MTLEEGKWHGITFILGKTVMWIVISYLIGWLMMQIWLSYMISAHNDRIIKNVINYNL
jgi:hypothetical protein